MPIGSITIPETVFLTDNGSLRAEAALGLRALAAKVSGLSSRTVEPVSLLHSSKIPADELNGQPAETLEQAIKRRYDLGQRRFCVLPLFFGPSAALVDYIPERLAKMRESRPGLQLRVLPCLAGTGYRQIGAIATLLAQGIRQTIVVNSLIRPQVVLVDHGSPLKSVCAVRNATGNALRRELGAEVSALHVCSMERREGKPYAFNDPLLENLFCSNALSESPVVLSYLFFFPGRHAGPGGDIAKITARAQSLRPAMRVFHTPLAAELPGLAEMLAKSIAAHAAGE